LKRRCDRHQSIGALDAAARKHEFTGQKAVALVSAA
jgi:hypothetical protein